MTIKFYNLETTFSGGIIVQELISDDIIRKWSVDDTVGDELFVKTGDLVIETIIDLPFNVNAKLNMIALFIDDMLYNCWVKKDSNFTEKNEKFGHRKYRLWPIQKVFYDHLKATAMKYDTDVNNWNTGLNFSFVSLDQIQLQNDPPIFDKYGFSIGDMLDNISGRSNSYGYDINAINHPIPIKGLSGQNQNDLCVLFRGVSKDIFLDPVQAAVDWTFWKSDTTSDEWNMNWFDIFTLAIFAFNCFVRVTPIIDGVNSTFELDIDLIPRINTTPSGQITTLKWLERNFVRDKFKLDGVKIDILNNTFKMGDPEGANVFQKTLDIADYVQNIASNDKQLYWGEADYDSIDANYDLINPYFASGLVEIYYNGLISEGHGYTGRALLDYLDGATVKPLKMLDFITVGVNDMQVTTIRINENGISQVEGIII